MDIINLVFIISPFLLFFIFISLGVLRKKDNIVVEYGGNTKTYTLNKSGINELKEQLFDHLNIDPDLFEEQLKRYHSIEKKPLGIIKINQSKHVDFHPSLKVPFSQHEKYIRKINSEFGYSLAGKIKNPISSVYNNTKDKLPSKEETFAKTKDFASKGIDVAKNQYGVNKKAKTIINKDGPLDDSDYKTLKTLMDQHDNILEDNVENLDEILKDEAKTLTYDEIADGTEKYKFLETQADKIEGLEAIYKESKKEAVASKIEEDNDIEIADIVDLKNSHDVDTIYEADNDGLSKLEKIAQDTDLLDSLIDKYSSTLQKELESAEEINKCNLLYSIITYAPNDSTKKQIAKTIKDKLIGAEVTSLNTEISDMTDKINSSDDLFDNDELLTERKNIIYELNMLKDNDVAINTLYDGLKKSDDVIIEKMVNKFITGNLIYAVRNDEKSLEYLSLPDFYENKKMIFDNATSDAFCDIIKAMPPIEQLKKIRGIKGALGLTKKKINEPNNYLADAILELIISRKGDIDDSKLSVLSKKIKPIIMKNILSNSGYPETKPENALFSDNTFDPKESPQTYFEKREKDNSLLGEFSNKLKDSFGNIIDLLDDSLNKTKPNATEIESFENKLIDSLKNLDTFQSELINNPQNIISYLYTLEKDNPQYRVAFEDIIKRIESGDTQFISKESN
ncbi:MAG: hypothetical protein GQ477_04430 [Nanohaloarchaea archaeon]|nr:hypothetical protein [Candidatus Nanohaloarchaea archaeon]